MGIRIQEGKLVFEIDAPVALKWDDHPAFARGLKKVQGTKAVDIAARLDDDGIVLLEAKDFRKHRIENKQRILTSDLAHEVADKARDSLAGLLWAHRRPHADAHTKRLTAALLRRAPGTPKAHVILWLEEDVPTEGHALLALRGEIEHALHPLTTRITVTSRAAERASQHRLSWLTVKASR